MGAGLNVISVIICGTDLVIRCTDDFNGAQCKAVCIEAGMIALRRGASSLCHEDYMDGILEVQSKKKTNLNYYA